MGYFGLAWIGLLDLDRVVLDLAYGANSRVSKKLWISAVLSPRGRM
jgi:hypothetical protein